MSQLFWRSAIFGSNGIFVSSWNDTEESRASLKNLTPFLPSEELNLKKNVDLIAIAGNCANPNFVNKNDDVIDSQTAVDIIDLFKHKPLNIEHNQHKIAGHILTTGFSKLKSSEILTREEVLDTNEPLNMSFGGVIYRKVYPELGKLLEAGANPDSKFYNAVSSSWEIMFNDYHIVLGSKDLREAEIVSDPKKIAELRKYLRKYGGKGKLDDGTPVYRKVVGKSVLPVGLGLVKSPAAEFVSGLITDNGKEKSTASERFLSLFNKSPK